MLTWPPGLWERVEAEVPPRERSAFIQEAVEQELQRRHRQRKLTPEEEAELAEGYRLHGGLEDVWTEDDVLQPSNSECPEGAATSEPAAAASP